MAETIPDHFVFSDESKESTAESSRQSSAAESKERITPISVFRPSRPALLSFDEIPVWLQDNNCIRSGYRPISYSAKECFGSWSYMHNESISIFTHLVPAILFLFAEAIIQPLFEVRYPDATIADRVVFAVFLTTATVCLGVSAGYHTLLNHSKHISELSLRCDFVGIVILTLGFFISGVYIGFYCDPSLRWIYWGMIIALGTTTIIILILPTFQGPRFRTFRLCAFVGTAMTGFAPIIHGFALYGWNAMIKSSGVPYYLGEGFLLGLGAVFYSMRIPEIYIPGKFDIYGASHQIFHVLVVLATILHLVGISLSFDYNYHYRKC